MSEYDVTVWLSKQHLWLQEAAVRIQSRTPLQNKDIIDFIKIMSGEMSVTPDLTKLTSQTSAPNRVSIVSIGNVNGIDRLNPRNPLTFSPNGLSVVYGRNGSGKSGYARILKRACGKTNELLRPNVYASPPTVQTVDFRINNNGSERNETWNAKGASLSSLSLVDIFDGTVGDFYLREDSEAAYTPPELTLFSELANVCVKVAAEIEAQKKRLLSKLPVMPSDYATTQIASTYNTLELADETQIQDLLEFSDDNLIILQELEERLSIADPASAAKKLRATKKLVEDVCESLKQVHKVIEPKAYVKMHELVSEAKEKRRIANEGTEILKTSSKLDGVGMGVWKSLWEAARTYSEKVAYKEFAFPNTEDGAFCVLCNQQLDSDGSMLQFRTVS